MTTQQTAAASGAASREIEDCPELNMNNYGSDDVDRLNDWAIRADAEIDRLRAALAAAPAQPVAPITCKSEQKRLATLWGFVPASPALAGEPGTLAMTSAEIDGISSAWVHPGQSVGLSVVRTIVLEVLSRLRARLEIQDADRAARGDAQAAPEEARHLQGDAKLAHDQCRAVISLATSVAEVYAARAAIVEHDNRLANQIGYASAAAMEWLGDELNAMDAAEDEDEWIDPIFDAAQERWPQHAQAAPVVAPELTQAARDVLAERQRQIRQEGYDSEHDDSHVNDEIAALAALFIMPEGAREWDATSTGYGDTLGDAMLPRDWECPGFGSRRRQLVKGAAMALAELERRDRTAARAQEQQP